MTTTTKTIGADWNEITLNDIAIGYPDADPVAEFHKIAQENGSTARWIPATGSVIADVNEEITVETLDEWRERAIDRACK